jgi:hypothetical protein
MYVLCVRTRIVVAASATVSGSRIEGFYAVSSFASSMISYIGGLPSKSRPFACFNSIQYVHVSSCSVMLTHGDHCSMTNLRLTLCMTAVASIGVQRATINFTRDAPESVQLSLT